MTLRGARLSSLLVSEGGGVYDKGKKKMKLLVMLCRVLFVNHNVKREVKLKQIQAVGWKSKQGLSQ